MFMKVTKKCARLVKLKIRRICSSPPVWLCSWCLSWFHYVCSGRMKAKRVLRYQDWIQVLVLWQVSTKIWLTAAKIISLKPPVVRSRARRARVWWAFEFNIFTSGCLWRCDVCPKYSLHVKRKHQQIWYADKGRPVDLPWDTMTFTQRRPLHRVCRHVKCPGAPATESPVSLQKKEIQKACNPELKMWASGVEHQHTRSPLFALFAWVRVYVRWSLWSRVSVIKLTSIKDFLVGPFVSLLLAARIKNAWCVSTASRPSTTVNLLPVKRNPTWTTLLGTPVYSLSLPTRRCAKWEGDCALNRRWKISTNSALSSVKGFFLASWVVHRRGKFSFLFR